MCVMKRIVFLMAVLFVCSTSIFSQKIIREKADEIVKSYIQSEGLKSIDLYVNINEPDDEGISITTSKGEKFTAKYACWAYSLKDATRRHYFFVKEENGNLLEVVTNNDVSELDASWVEMNLSGMLEIKSSLNSPYPNPVGDLLYIPCNGKNTHVEIYDLSGTRLFSELLTGEEVCHLNVSFLKSGMYLVNISGKTHRIVKK